MTNFETPTATYSPDDNKIRIYPVTRLSAEDYAALSQLTEDREEYLEADIKQLQDAIKKATEVTTK